MYSQHLGSRKPKHAGRQCSKEAEVGEDPLVLQQWERCLAAHPDQAYREYEGFWVGFQDLHASEV